jgi:hypothetical protein
VTTVISSMLSLVFYFSQSMQNGPILGFFLFNTNFWNSQSSLYIQYYDTWYHNKICSEAMVHNEELTTCTSYP